MDFKKHLCEIAYMDWGTGIRYVKDVIAKDSAFTYPEPLEIFDYIEGNDCDCIYYSTQFVRLHNIYCGD